MVNDISEINKMALENPSGFVLASEKEYRKRIGEIAQLAAMRQGLKIILLAGPSASGKTTSSLILRECLCAAGMPTETVSLDDYYKTQEKMPRDEYGMLDFESVYSLLRMVIMEQRKKFTAALSLFLVCVILMLYTSYAWLVVSSAPEVRNIETNVGANGSLEIALLNDETYIDPATIRTGVGDSLMAQDPMVSNTTWGNVIDLSAEEYGLQEISLKPSRLNVQTDADGNYVVGDHLLMMADFGADGRVSFISDNMVSGVFAEEKFFTYFFLCCFICI